MDSVSTVIPTFNRDKYIVESLESVMAQTHRNNEIIVVDDGSTDSTCEILRPYVETNKIRYVLQKNQGVSAARNKGVSVSKGRYVAFLDSDDVWECGHLEQLLRAMKRHPANKIAFSAVEFFCESGDADAHNDAFGRSVKDCLARAFERHGDDISVSTPRLLQTIFELGFPFRCQASLVEKSLFHQHDLWFDPEISYTEDAHFMTLAAYHFPFSYVNRVGCRIRKHSENDNRDKYAQKMITSLELRAEKSKRFFRGKQISGEEKRALRRMLWSFNYEVARARSAVNGLSGRLTESARLIYKVPCLMSIKSAAGLLLDGGGRR